MKSKELLSNLELTRRYFSTYSGIKLPIKLSQPLEEASIANRNTYFIGYYDKADVMIGFQKMVYGEIELQHYYVFNIDGKLIQAEITNVEQEVTVLDFNT
ncbi:MAG: DUF6156 family protein [Methylophilus sp.]|nr:DUF6156 family protein [Methylophilus sp.]